MSRKNVGDYQLESFHLMKVMVGHNSYCCGEVQASDVSPDGDGVTGICMSYVGWKATGLRAEKQVIALPCPRICVRFRSVTTEGEQVFAGIHIRQEGLKTLVVANINLLPVVEASPFEMLIVHFETKGMDQVQPYFRSSAEAGNVPGIGRYFEKWVEGTVIAK